MPYARKTTRLVRRHIISYDDVCDANFQVTNEMDRLGLWHPRLDDVVVWHVPVSFGCYGWFLEEGDIYIPAVTGAHLSDFFSGHHTRLTDVLRHEWAHAVADRRPGLVRKRRFRDTFGGTYESTKPVDEFDPDHHLTRYAASNPCEDFAEVFAYFLRHRGRLPIRLASKPSIARKWRFIASLARG